MRSASRSADDVICAWLNPLNPNTRPAGFGTLQAHVARANPVWRDVDVADNDEVLVVFNAGDVYVSSTWYPSKHEHHKQVPTWNYVVVHVHGRIRIRDDEKFVRSVVARLTRSHEDRKRSLGRWAMLRPIIRKSNSMESLVSKSRSRGWSESANSVNTSMRVIFAALPRCC
ncbi:putative FMN-binding regulatory protein PaiB [Paraburkholderia sp. WSM4180]|nr:putative FMN-binding regulatory protein PaiB [Paraburkholderia sp. WSM4180]